METEEVQIKTEIDIEDEEDSPLVDVSDLLQVEMKEDVIHNVDTCNTTSSKLLTKRSIVNSSYPGCPGKKVKLMTNQFSVVDVPVDQNKLKRQRLRKVELERERRREMTDLYDNLHYWVQGCVDSEESRKDLQLKNKYSIRKLVTTMPYHERMNAAIECIQDLEEEIEEQEKTYRSLVAKNTELQHRMFELCDTAAVDEPKILYRCNMCPKKPSNIRDAFLHHNYEEHKMQCELDKQLVPSMFKHRNPAPSPKSVMSVMKPFTKNRVVLKVSPSRSGSVNDDTRQSRVNPATIPASSSGRHFCLQCSISFIDKTALHLHSLLHKNLMYFQCPWPKCQLVFGLPSKLKTHHFLCHEIVLAAEEKCVLSSKSKVALTRQIIELLSSKWKIGDQEEALKHVDNFLEASLDATVILDEMNIDAKVDKMLKEDSLDTLLKGLKDDSNRDEIVIYPNCNYVFNKTK